MISDGLDSLNVVGLICADPGSVSPTLMAVLRIQDYSVRSQVSCDYSE